MSINQKSITELEGLTEHEKDQVVDFLFYTEGANAVWQPREITQWTEICQEALQARAREKRITDLFNHYAELYEEAAAEDNWTELGYLGFVCNALSSAIFRSNTKELRDHFAKHARNT